MVEESTSRLEILGNILDFYREQPEMSKGDTIEKIEAYLILLHALYSGCSEELCSLDTDDVDFLENLFDCFNGYLNAMGEEMVKIFQTSLFDLNPIPMYGHATLLPIQALEMIRTWNKYAIDYWQIGEDLSELEELVESDLFFEKFFALIVKLQFRINSKFVVAVEDLI